MFSPHPRRPSPPRAVSGKMLCCGLLCCLITPLLLAQAPPAVEKDPVRVDDKTEAVIKGALRWLAGKQQPNGAWGSSAEEKQHSAAIGGYTLMAFLGGGQLPGEGEFGKNVSLGIQYLLDSMDGQGFYGNKNDGQYMYGHGVATIALSELYGASKLATMRPKLERAIRIIIAAQNREGGWRYRPISYDADISVTVLQVVALRSAKNAGLDVPQKTIDDAVQYVKRCFISSSGGFGYQPGQSAGFARTAAAIYSLQVCGLYDDPMVKKGSEYLMKEYKDGHMEWFTYGNFYAAPAQYMQGGETWKKWYDKLHQTLMSRVTTEGDKSYWSPDKINLDGGRAVGAVYCTSVYAMILAMPYHYIPLYQR